MTRRELLAACSVTGFCSVLVSGVVYGLMRPKYQYFRMDAAPMRVLVDSGIVELFDRDSGRWVTFEEAKRILEKRR